MIFKFFNKEEQLNDNSDLLNVACLMIHAAKIDENYTDKERKIIKKTLTMLNNKEDIDKLISEAEKKENDSNHIQDFTKNIKNMDKENKIEVIKNIWSIILSDGTSDMYEENLMRRLAGLLYLDSKTMGDIKISIQKKLKK
tara:strand:+ start:156 stop:578 length:423 start_codon:yes stop_codon:yes gene_type:complete